LLLFLPLPAPPPLLLPGPPVGQLPVFLPPRPPPGTPLPPPLPSRGLFPCPLGRLLVVICIPFCMPSCFIMDGRPGGEPAIRAKEEKRAINYSLKACPGPAKGLPGPGPGAN